MYMHPVHLACIVVSEDFKADQHDEDTLSEW